MSNFHEKNASSSSQLTLEEEDHIILARITNDERSLRRVVKKFHNYASVSHTPLAPPSAPVSVEEARESFLVELASFQLSLKKSEMVCEAEARQVEEYERERKRIDEEHDTLRAQIEELKTALEHAQLERRRKIEYDLVAEKVTVLPSREELEQSIQILENDMAAIRAEHETQNRTIQGQKLALDTIISDLGNLRFFGKERDLGSSAASPLATSVVDNTSTEAGENTSEVALDDNTMDTEKEDEKEDGEEVASPSNSVLESVPPTGEGAEDDIEMGEVEEDPKDKSKRKDRDEELEEGEASDTSSALTDPPDD